jgi:hypothetical protein
MSEPQDELSFLSITDEVLKMIQILQSDYDDEFLQNEASR